MIRFRNRISKGTIIISSCINLLVIIALMIIVQQCSVIQRAREPTGIGGMFDMAQHELDVLKSKVSRFDVVNLTETSGELLIRAEQSLTIDDLRGIELDENQPAMFEAPPAYDRKQVDDYPQGKAPYVAKGIKPFRFKYYNCEFNYGGWHNQAMTDYASTHGFNILYPYTRKPEQLAPMPKDTKWMNWGGFVNWEKWLTDHQIPDGRYDMLVGMDLVKMLADSGVFKKKAEISSLMIDMEHQVLSPDKLREKGWYPKNVSDSEKQVFEKRYYDGCAQTYISAVKAARDAGYKNISIYGWQPFNRTWWNLDKVRIEPQTYWAWNNFGKQIYDAVDIINPSVYCFYWSPQNVPYVLANIDLNMKLLSSMDKKKPLRPYYWTLLHGGGDGWRWWERQPLPDEEARAMIALGFFTGFDGFVLWNWSGTENHHIAPPLVKGDKKGGERHFQDVMVDEDFGCKPEGGIEPFNFKRYDVLHILEVDDKTENVRFQLIEKGDKKGEYGIRNDKPIYVMTKEKLVAHLRPKSEPVSAVIEGMAIVKPFEYILRHGEVKIDVSPLEQFKKANSMPIVRRVKLDKIHVICTYNPGSIHDGEPNQVILRDFDNRKGLTLKLPADEKTRIFVVVEQ